MPVEAVNTTDICSRSICAISCEQRLLARKDGKQGHILFVVGTITAVEHAIRLNVLSKILRRELPFLNDHDGCVGHQDLFDILLLDNVWFSHGCNYFLIRPVCLPGNVF